MGAVIDIYKNKKGHFIIVPSGVDRNGIGRNLNSFKKLEEPVDVEGLGKTIKEYLKISEESAIIEDVKALGNVFEMATGIKGWSEFSKEHVLVSVIKNSESKYKISPMKRVKGGGYLSEKGDPELELETNAFNEDIGEAVIKAFSCETLKKINQLLDDN